MRISVHSAVRFAASFLWIATTAVAVEVQVSISLDTDGIWISYPSLGGVTYQLEQSTNLVDWQTNSPPRQGTGSMIIEDPITAVEPRGFFRVVYQEASTNLSPTPDQMGEMLVGTTWKGYRFISTNRFRWFNEPGNWVYTKTGPDTGLIVFTYDEDGNNPLTYREEVGLAFITSTSGTARYSEWIGNIENPTSVRTFDFSFDAAIARQGIQPGGR